MFNNTNNLTDIINETSLLTNTTVSDSSSGLTTSEKIALGLGIPTLITTIGIFSLIAYQICIKARRRERENG